MSKESQEVKYVPVIHPDPEFERDVYVEQPSFDPSVLFGGQMGGLRTNGAAGFGGAGSMDGVPDIFSLLQGMQGTGSGEDNPLFSMMAGLQSFSSMAGDGATQPQSRATSVPTTPPSTLVKILQSKLHISALAVLTYLLAANDVMFR